MNILDMIKNEAAEGGSGVISFFEKDGALYLLNIVFETQDETLYIIPADEWKEISEMYEVLEGGGDEDDDLCDRFWENIAQYQVGTFEVE